MNRYSGFKLLIVDDHAHNLFTLRALIEQRMEVAIFEATSGRQAIDITLQQPNTQRQKYLISEEIHHANLMASAHFRFFFLQVKFFVHFFDPVIG